MKELTSKVDKTLNLDGKEIYIRCTVSYFYYYEPATRYEDSWREIESLKIEYCDYLQIDDDYPELEEVEGLKKRLEELFTDMWYEGTLRLNE